MPRSTAQYKRYSKWGRSPYTGEIQFDDWRLRRRRESAEVAPRGRAPLDRGFINRVVKWELKHIPRGDKGSPQNFLRFSYNILRRKHLAQRISRHETLKELVEKIQKIHHDFTPLYDKEIFKI
jgi:hypothetical protein